MKKPPTPSKTQSSRTTKLKRTPISVPEEGPSTGPSTKANASKKRSKHSKICKDTASPKRENTTGLAILPDEILLEILSYYPDGNAKVHSGVDSDLVDANDHFAHRERLIALSQTCRNLRRFFRPYVWRRIEVFTGMCVSAGEVLNTDKQVALELIRQLEIVTIRDPVLAAYINIVNVEIRSYNVRAVLVELGRCLNLFPNVHTLKLSHTPRLKVHLERVTTQWFGRFPQIRSLIVREESYPL